MLREVANQIEELLPGSPQIAFLFFHIEGSLMQNPTIPDTSGPITGSIAWVDTKGNPTAPAAAEVPTIASDNEAVGTATIADDKTTVTFTPTGALGAAIVTVDCVNESGTDIRAQATITVIATDITTASIDFPDAAPVTP